jgi:phenylalanyl-tRNA synthetase beta chain
MLISWNWLKRHVELDGADPFGLVARFTMAVAEVEGVHAVGDGLEAVLAGRVLSVAPHPQADKLKVARVTVGGEPLTVVCGAPNCEVGGVYPLALPGARLPGGEVKLAAIRGVDSSGMLCSERDLGLTDDHSGLLVLPAATAPGTPLPRVPGFEGVKDVLVEIDNKSVTHRPDLWGHRGIAREVAVLLGRPLRPFNHEGVDLEDGRRYLLTHFNSGHRPLYFRDAGHPLSVTVEAPDLCPRYVAAIYEGVTVAPSPFWLRLALSRVGVRPISNVVDLTNFVMLDMGNPLHAFDARTLHGDAIVVRRAREGEAITTLDGVERALLPSDLLIADAERGVALAGVMGGQDTEIRPDTARVVLESANFHPGTIRRTALRLGHRTDASARFEKSLDPALALDAQLLFGALLLETVPGSRVASRLHDVWTPVLRPTTVHVPAGFLEKRLGCELPAGFAERVLTGLEFTLTRAPDGGLDLGIPSFRATKDISIPEDIVEEVGRFFGYDNVPHEPPKVRIHQPRPRHAATAREGALRTLVLEHGFHQLQTYSFLSNSFLERLAFDPGPGLALRNPISSDMTRMRTTLVANLLEVVAGNSRNYDEVRLCEAGRVFLERRDAEGLPLQPERLALAAWGRGATDGLYGDVKGALEALLTRFRLPEPRWLAGSGEALPFLHPTKAARVECDGARVGWLAMLHPAAMDALKLKPGRAVVAEVDLASLVGLWARDWGYRRLPRFPGVRYEISAIVPLEVTHQRLEDAIRGSGGDLLRGVRFLVAFQGAPIPEGRKSVSYEMTFGRDDATLTDDEANAAAAAIVAHLKESCGAYLREA